MFKIEILYKIVTVIILNLYCLIAVQAQQEPQYTNYMFNTQSNNPAYAGSKSKGSATLLTRLQWVGLEGAPRSTSFTFQSPLPRTNMGLGLAVVSDQTGPAQDLTVNAQYGYHVAINKTNRISFGLGLGFYNYRNSLDQVEINTASDKAFANAYKSNFQPNIGVGLYYYGGKLTLGASAPNLLAASLSPTPTSITTGLRQHFFFLANYIIPINEEVNFRPGIGEKIVVGAPPSTDITAQFTYSDIVIVGTSYRIGDAISALIAVQATQEILVGYSYDYSTSKLNQFNKGSHEIFVTYQFKFPKKNTCDVEPLFHTYKRKQKVVKNGNPLN